MRKTTEEMYSPHFSKQEMQRSGMAIRLGIENQYSPSYAQNQLLHGDKTRNRESARP